MLKLTCLRDGKSVNFLKDQLANRHALAEHERNRTEVDDFQRDRAAEAGMDRWSREMDEQPRSRPAALSLDAGRQTMLEQAVGRNVDWQGEVLDRLSKNELVWLKRIAVGGNLQALGVRRQEFGKLRVRLTWAEEVEGVGPLRRMDRYFPSRTSTEWVS
jgi:hypothetical protein